MARIMLNGVDYSTPTASGVSGIKGNAETIYRTGNVNITPENIGISSRNIGYLDNKLKFIAYQGNYTLSNYKAEQYDYVYDLSNTPYIHEQSCVNDIHYYFAEYSTMHAEISVNDSNIYSLQAKLITDSTGAHGSTGYIWYNGIDKRDFYILNLFIDCAINDDTPDMPDFYFSISLYSTYLRLNASTNNTFTLTSFTAPKNVILKRVAFSGNSFIDQYVKNGTLQGGY